MRTYNLIGGWMHCCNTKTMFGLENLHVVIQAHKHIAIGGRMEHL